MVTTFEIVVILLVGAFLPAVAYLTVRGSMAASGPVRLHSIGAVVVSGVAMATIIVLMLK